MGYGSPAPDVYNNQRGMHEYQLAIQPSTPIRLGQRVRLLALTPLMLQSDNLPHQFDTHDTHVVGTVTDLGDKRTEGVSRGTTGVVTRTATIQNECRGNMVDAVSLEVIVESRECGDPSRKDRRNKKRKRGSGDAAEKQTLRPRKRPAHGKTHAHQAPQLEEHNGTLCVNTADYDTAGVREAGQDQDAAEGRKTNQGNRDGNDKFLEIMSCVRPWPLGAVTLCSGKSCYLALPVNC